MAANTYVALKTTTVASATASVTIDTIPQGYTDLVLVVNGGLTTNNQSFRFQVGNGTIDTGNNYSYTYIAGNGSSASSSRASNTSGFNAYHAAGQSDSNLKNNVIVHFQNYSNTTTFKTILNRGNTDLETAATVALWRSTSAIDRILIGTTNGNIQAGTTISVYGVSNAGETGGKAIGGVVTSDASYWYHTFAMSGDFTPTENLSVDYLVVAGGGGGGSGFGGGGGAGGFLTGTSYSVTSGTKYACLVGAGGAAGRNSGSNSTFGSSLTAIGGGGGGETFASGLAGQNGGSGGGGATFGGATPGTGTSGQGNAGGAGYNGGGSTLQGGGGGGASAAGGAAGTNGGNGGNGTASSISGTSVTYAGGGGGGAGTGSAGTAGTGGGGAGGRGVNGSAGTANTGGGGGGSDGTGGAGGSGIVIVRYAK